MLGRRRVFTVEPLGCRGIVYAELKFIPSSRAPGPRKKATPPKIVALPLRSPQLIVTVLTKPVLERNPLLMDGTGEDLAHGCVVSGVSSTYRRIPDTSEGSNLASQQGDKALRDPGRQMPIVKLASRDSGVEMAVGDSLLATSMGLCQDSSDFEPTRDSRFPAHLGRLRASQKLEQMLERSHQLPASTARASRCLHSLEPSHKPECEMCLLGARAQETLEVGMDPEGRLADVALVGSWPEAWACLPGQGLRYLEHLCQVLEQMARLQQLCLQLQPQRPAVDPDGEAAKPALPSVAPGSEVPKTLELLSLSKSVETGATAASLLEGERPSADPPRLLENPVCPSPPSQGHRVKVLFSRIRWKNPPHSEPPAPPEDHGPEIESRNLSSRSPHRLLRKTFMPSLVVKKQRAKNLSVC